MCVINNIYRCVFTFLVFAIMSISMKTISFASATGLNAGYDKINVVLEIEDNLNQFKIDVSKLRKEAVKKIEKGTKLKVIDKGAPIIMIWASASISPDDAYAILTQSNVMVNGYTEYIKGKGYVIVENGFNLKLVPGSMVKETINDHINELVNDFIQSYNEDSKKHKH